MQIRLLVVLGCLLAAPACASSGEGDAVSRQLLAMSHRVTEDRLLGISDDGSYWVVDSMGLRATSGRLSPAELRELESRVTEARLNRLYEFRAKEEEACSTVVDSYFLHSKAGVSCFVISDVADPEARADIEFFDALYKEKSKIE